MSRFAPPSSRTKATYARGDARKEAANQELNPKHFRALADNFNNIALPEKAVIGSYCAFRDEMDPATLGESLRAKGHLISLPIITRNRDPLIFRLYEQGDLPSRQPYGDF